VRLAHGLYPGAGLNQVVGTHQLRAEGMERRAPVEPRCKGGNSWNVDCMGREGDVSFLTFENGVFGGLEVQKAKEGQQTKRGPTGIQ